MTATATQDARARPSAPAPGPDATAPRRGRRRLAWAVVVALYLATALWSFDLRASQPRDAYVELYLDGVHVRADGAVDAVPAHQPARYLPDSRVLADAAGDPDAEAVAERHRSWLAAGTVPGRGTEYEQLVRDALLDMHVLTGATSTEGATSAPGASVAGWSPRWRYVWPRDSSFVAAALAATGHPEDATEVLAFVQDMQSADGAFQARYLPDGSGVPDSRGIQLDGNGWVLWSTAAVLQALADDAERAATFERLRPLVDASTDHILALTDSPEHLPPPSSDYWEVRERHLTLGTVGPLLAGLEAAAEIYAGADLPDRAEAAATRATQVRGAVARTFRPAGYTRYAGAGGPLSGRYNGEGRDAATAFLLPPFVEEPLPGAASAWLSSGPEMARAGGGLAPGAGWKQDGISWTPETTLYAVTAAHNGRPEQARRWLDWVQAHRTGSGAIPEKVLSSGGPAAVAPLTWSGANVVLAVAELEAAGEL
ncbi:glycoside hydrolase family 15 [Georgenia sp. 10Sc9-8]|uniref:Glycoside hydrolase family 15 n=1 Tax=Georgenia halotolerans TaxID=3028317 RepID=A0ABT5TXA8_9MICO|nr:glycoside hydrolase family 15 [Georgenia halotolerans]